MDRVDENRATVFRRNVNVNVNRNRGRSPPPRVVVIYFIFLIAVLVYSLLRHHPSIKLITEVINYFF